MIKLPVRPSDRGDQLLPEAGQALNRERLRPVWSQLCSSCCRSLAGANYSFLGRPGCVLHGQLGVEIESIEQLATLGAHRAVALAPGHFASCLFGANEAPQALFTTDHGMVLIDNETLFQFLPCPLNVSVLPAHLDQPTAVTWEAAGLRRRPRTPPG